MDIQRRLLGLALELGHQESDDGCDRLLTTASGHGRQERTAHAKPCLAADTGPSRRRLQP
jgi:hypothetical protein